MNSVNEMFDITGRVAIVTGASSGLGKVFAGGLAGAGANVVLAARRKDQLDSIVSHITASGGSAHPVVCDVSESEEVDTLVKATLERFQRIDILVNNAGVSNVSPIESEAVADFRKVLDINITGTFLCTQRCGQVMLKAGKGSVINIASILGLVGAGLIPQAAYTASKGAVVNFTREVAAQWARKGIRVNAIAPGWFPSEMTEDMFQDEGGARFVRRKTPMGRGGDPEELLGALLLLASDASSYITGQTIAVDGGWTCI